MPPTAYTAVPTAASLLLISFLVSLVFPQGDLWRGRCEMLSLRVCLCVWPSRGARDVFPGRLNSEEKVIQFLPPRQGLSAKWWKRAWDETKRNACRFFRENVSRLDIILIWKSGFQCHFYHLRGVCSPQTPGVFAFGFCSPASPSRSWMTWERDVLFAKVLVHCVFSFWKLFSVGPLCCALCAIFKW